MFPFGDYKERVELTLILTPWLLQGPGVLASKEPFSVYSWLSVTKERSKGEKSRDFVGVGSGKWDFHYVETPISEGLKNVEIGENMPWCW